MQGHQMPAVNGFIVGRNQMKRLDLGSFGDRLANILPLFP